MLLRMQGTYERHLDAHPVKALVMAKHPRPMFAAILTSAERPPASSVHNDAPWTRPVDPG
jgi:hypothetical protein